MNDCVYLTKMISPVERTVLRLAMMLNIPMSIAFGNCANVRRESLFKDLSRERDINRDDSRI